MLGVCTDYMQVWNFLNNSLGDLKDFGCRKDLVMICLDFDDCCIGSCILRRFGSDQFYQGSKSML